MKAEVQIVTLEHRIYLRVLPETDAEELLLAQMEYWSPCFSINKQGALEAAYDTDRK